MFTFNDQTKLHTQLTEISYSWISDGFMSLWLDTYLLLLTLTEWEETTYGTIDEPLSTRISSNIYGTYSELLAWITYIILCAKKKRVRWWNIPEGINIMSLEFGYKKMCWCGLLSGNCANYMRSLKKLGPEVPAPLPCFFLFFLLFPIMSTISHKQH